MSDRVTDLEIHLTHQQHQIEELNELVYRQQLEIEAVISELRQIKEQLQMGLSSRASEAEEEPPPHY
jgi:uncharacterized coiled-coil protein SlyX